MKKIQDGHLPRLPDLVWNDPVMNLFCGRSINEWGPGYMVARLSVDGGLWLKAGLL